MTTDLQLEFDGTAVLLPVRAQPKSSKNRIDGIHDGRLKVCVTQAPEKGKANKALLKVIKDGLNLRRSQIELHKGETAGLKVFRITEITPDELHQKIRDALNKSG
ncbi:DUF167 domain-containing protein [Gimesia fumaroli]|uniref:UPF0235 protein Enr17x_48820 n=1 Tax=Gimesia fumaroli TaxID=2527976 RepID=A0A518II88_9PLAN|nr:DUF167 domain-containing protein [Gimesia fumaroli]QDV52813.1 hypothetical protein Enr17x_48820 [Gimesia fumaroli]